MSWWKTYEKGNKRGNLGVNAMNADPVLLQMKYSRIVALLAKRKNISLMDALTIFYHSQLYQLISEGISDMHCMSDEYLVQELMME